MTANTAYLHTGLQMHHPDQPDWGTITLGAPVEDTHFWVTFDDDGETLMLRRAYLHKCWRDTGI